MVVVMVVVVVVVAWAVMNEIVSVGSVRGQIHVLIDEARSFLAQEGRWLITILSDVINYYCR